MEIFVKFIKKLSKDNFLFFNQYYLLNELLLVLTQKKSLSISGFLELSLHKCLL